MAIPSASPVSRTFTLSPALLGLVGVALLTFLAGCSSSTSTEVPNQADAKIVEVAVRENASQYVWNDADISGQVDVVDKFGKVTTLATGRRLVLSEGATVRLAGSGLQGVSEAQVWVFSTPRLLNKIPVNTDGSFSSQIIVPSHLEPGQHTVLISATLTDGRVVAVNIPAFVPTDNTPVDSSNTSENSIPPTSVNTVLQASSTTTLAPTTTVARPRATTTTVANNRVSPATTAAPTTVPQSSVATTVPLTTSTTTSTTTTTVPATTTTTTSTTTTTTSTTSTTTTTLPPVTYGVTYSGNTSTGGVIPTDGTSYTSGAIVTVSGNTGSLVKAGFEFNGWCTTQPTAGAACGGTGQAASSTFTISSNTTLYAVWTPATQTISYAAGTSGNGNGPSTPTTALYGSTFTTPANTFTRIGHTFAGWTDSINTYAAGVTYPASGVVVTGNVTLTATWTPNSFIISYARGIGTGTGPSTPITASYGSTFTTPANTFTRANYTFAGWTDGTNTYQAGSTYPVSGTIAANVSLTATWTAITYSITYYDTNSGSGSGGDGGTAPAAQSGSGTASVTLTANTLVLDGYGFYGWTTTDGSTTVEYTNAQAVPIPSNTTLHLYPVWGARTFGTQIGLGANGQTNAAALQSDGKMIIVGTFTSWNGTSAARVIRLQSDGTYDPTFNAALGTGPAAGADRVLVQSDNKVVISGNLSTWSGSLASYRLVRLNSDGSLDAAFNTNIGTGPSGTGLNSTVFGYAQQSDGKLIIVGSFTSWNGTTVGRIVRLNTDGTLDTDFSAKVGSGANNDVSRVNLQTSGKLVLTGSFTSWSGTTVGRIVRLNTDGTLDAAFSTNAGTGFNSFTYGSVVQSDDKIVVVGNFVSYNGTTANRVLRLNADGTLDTAFTTNVGAGPGSTAQRIALQNNGQILVAQGFTTWAGTTVGSLVRLNTNGTRDTAFTSTIGTALTESQVMSMTVQGEKTLVMGMFTSWNGTPVGRIVRINADGTID